jgi:hypothetical protein
MLSFVDMKQPSVDNALAPIEFILRIAAGFLLLILLGTGIAAAAGRTLPGEGDAVCVTVPVTAINGNSGHGIDRIVDNRHSGARPDLLHPGTEASATSVELCDTSPSKSQHLWSSALRMSPFAYTGGFLMFAFLLTRSARRHGLFSPHVALGVGRLGLYVLLGYVAVTLLRMWTQVHLMLSMTSTIRSGLWYYFLDFSWAIAFAGFGLLTVGRVMAQSVRMQREIDATV